jgi:hypothetical protein
MDDAAVRGLLEELRDSVLVPDDGHLMRLLTGYWSWREAEEWGVGTSEPEASGPGVGSAAAGTAVSPGAGAQSAGLPVAGAGAIGRTGTGAQAGARDAGIRDPFAAGVRRQLLNAIFPGGPSPALPMPFSHELDRY